MPNKEQEIRKFKAKTKTASTSITTKLSASTSLVMIPDQLVVLVAVTQVLMRRSC